MAMTMTGEATLPAGRPKVWAMLNDPAVLKACIPGCQSLEKTSDNVFRRGREDQDRTGRRDIQRQGRSSPTSIRRIGYTISGEGEGGIAGFAKGGAKVRLVRRDGRNAARLRRRRPMSAARSRSSARA